MATHGKKFTFKHAVGVDINTLVYLKMIKGDCSIAEKLRDIIQFYKENEKHEKK